MANIGSSSIFVSDGSGIPGPIGATGATGNNQTIPGSTGNTGTDSNYIKNIRVNQETGSVEFELSTGDWVSPTNNIFKGASGIYAGITAINIGGGLPIIKNVIGGTTLDFYNIRTAGRLGVTYDSSGNLNITITPYSNVASVDASIEPNRVVYAKTNSSVSSTDLIQERIPVSKRIGSTPYGFVNFGGETAGRNVVADIIETQLTVGPISRGERVIETGTHYTWGPEGITLDLSRASVYRIATPIGIKGFSTNNISTIPDGQVLSVTLIVDGDDVWNFPENVYFDDKDVSFYPGTNILHVWKQFDSDNWYANFTARGFGITLASNPGVRGSCCYFDADNEKYCEEYVTEDYCNERNGTFAGLVACDKNPCLLGSESAGYDGICCTEGRCVPDIDPNLCQAINGYFITGITCGAYETTYPEESDTPNSERLCKDFCQPLKICCKNGECLGQQTDKYCINALGGTVVEANDCDSAKCCDHIIAPGACCTVNDQGNYSCSEVNTPFECKSTGGIYMGKNTNCTDSDICCTVEQNITCYHCTGNCADGCVEDIDTTPCVDRGSQYYETPEACSIACEPKAYYRCNGTNCEDGTFCGVSPAGGWILGSCSTLPCGVAATKTCYKSCLCATDSCESLDILLNGLPSETPCSQLVQGTQNADYVLDECNCGTVCNDPDKYAACFWCYPHFEDGFVNEEIPSSVNNLSCNHYATNTNNPTFCGSFNTKESCNLKSLPMFGGCYWDDNAGLCKSEYINPNAFPGSSWITCNGDNLRDGRLPCSFVKGTTGFDQWSEHFGASPYRAVIPVDLSTRARLESLEVGLTFANPFNQDYVVEMKRNDNNGKGYHFVEAIQGGSQIDIVGRGDEVDLEGFRLTPVGNPFRVPSPAYCTFIGTYPLQKPKSGTSIGSDPVAQNQRVEDCLERFGYVPKSRGGDFPDGVTYDFNLKRMVKPIPPLGYVFCTPDYGTGSPQCVNFNYLEPYQQVMDVNYLPCPFPPIWGRITMYQAIQTCGTGFFSSASNSLMLMDPKITLDLAKAFYGSNDPSNNPNLNEAGVTYGWQWWNNYIKGYLHHNRQLNQYIGDAPHTNGLYLQKYTDLPGVPYELPNLQQGQTTKDFSWPSDLSEGAGISYTTWNSKKHDLRYQFYKDMRRGLLYQVGKHGDEGEVGSYLGPDGNNGCGCADGDGCICTDITTGGNCDSPWANTNPIRFDPYRKASNGTYGSTDTPAISLYNFTPTGLPQDPTCSWNPLQGTLIGFAMLGERVTYVQTNSLFTLPDGTDSTDLFVSASRTRGELFYARPVSSEEPYLRNGCRPWQISNPPLDSKCYTDAQNLFLGGEPNNAICDECHDGWHLDKLANVHHCRIHENDFGRAILGRNLRYTLIDSRTSDVFWYPVYKNGSFIVDSDGNRILDRTIDITVTYSNQRLVTDKGIAIFSFAWWKPQSAGDANCTNTDWSVGTDPSCQACCIYNPQEGSCCGCGQPVIDCTTEVVMGCGSCGQGGSGTLPDGRTCCKSPYITQCGNNGDECQCNEGSSGTNGPNDGTQTGPGSGSPYTANRILFRNSHAPEQVNSIPYYKSVKIAPGVCVNMLCPECNSYETC